MGDGGLQWKRFSVIGAARSGLAVAALLQRHGGEVLLSEQAPAEKMPDAVAELARLGISCEFGGNSERLLDADAVVLSPGVPTEMSLVQRAMERGIPVVSELEVASWFCPGPIVAVTGTNGKTTTTSLLGRMFGDAKRPSVVAGNIGTAFSLVVDGLTPDSTAILEVSSFQLDHVQRFRPRVAVLLNITPDHLDRYGHSFEKYIASKRRLFENQREGDVIVYNHDDEQTREVVERHAHPSVTRQPFSVREPLGRGAFVEGGMLTVVVGGTRSELLPVEAISIRGVHNLYNSMASSLAAMTMGVSSASLRATLRNFKGVEHRLEFVRELDGITYVNDSKATNVDSVWYALQSFTGPIIVMLGGRDKGNDYTRLTDPVRRHVKAVVAIGESADTVVHAFSGIVPVRTAGTMDEAVHLGAALAVRGDVVLLSPACASFDWFENYEHRGRVFKECVMKLKGGT